jgi:hypothetical protein
MTVSYMLFCPFFIAQPTYNPARATTENVIVVYSVSNLLQIACPSSLRNS